MLRRLRPVAVVLVTALAAVLLSAATGDGHARTAAAAGGARLHVVALGDSVPAGSHCGCTPFPTLYGRALASRLHRGVHVADDAKGGWTSADVLAALRDTGSTRARDVAAADVVVVEIGANDTSDQHDAVTSGQCDAHPGAGDCVADELAALKRHLAAIDRQIAVLRAGQPTVVAYVGYWNVFEDGDVAYQAYSAQGLAASRRLTRRVNGVIWTQAHASAAAYVDLVAPFRHHGHVYLTSLLAADGNHPSAKGHRLIARVLLGDTLHRVRALS
ncbi:SGNH/GDSL hydrolase family protein [Nocardioides mangrovicus]|uniref:SGNH/GDSL hydrolase family protein n=1 Tax=Nocardioides mangrovicus TaxID=2478913 RepID=A0A3L8P6Q6_9ACTN|nr:SGNH/GDSL hydrolase family protein [Nocardioides mangrovicus]RLV50403.1 SGNH/GDSL hydrolase family protein [Nocardioides mangrovicus]